MEDTDTPICPSWDIQSQIKQMMSNKSSGRRKETINTKNSLIYIFNNLDADHQNV